MTNVVIEDPSRGGEFEDYIALATKSVLIIDCTEYTVIMLDCDNDLLGVSTMSDNFLT